MPDIEFINIDLLLFVSHYAVYTSCELILFVLFMFVL